MTDARIALFNRIKANVRKKNYYHKNSSLFTSFYEKKTVGDPQKISSVVNKVVDEKGWNYSVKVGGIFTHWENLVGEGNAKFSIPESFDHGKLFIRCDSTARASQFRLLEFDFIAKINRKLGDEYIRKIIFKGPDTPSWHQGVRHIKGRGPRDTYG